MEEYLDIDKKGQSKFKVSKTSKIDYLIKEGKMDEALAIVNQKLKDNESYEHLNLKGIILDKMFRYEESIEFFDKALSINSSDKIRLNKANALYDWAKVSYFPQMEYEKALDLINSALNIIPETEDPSEYYFLKAEILETRGEQVKARKYYLTAFKDFDKVQKLESQIEYLNSSEDVLISITGSNFYNFTPHEGTVVDLCRQEDNEHDKDAIAVMIDGEIVGYVANSDYTLINEVESATDIKDIISDNQKAEILFVYLDNYIIAKLI